MKTSNAILVLAMTAATLTACGNAAEPSSTVKCDHILAPLFGGGYVAVTYDATFAANGETRVDFSVDGNASFEEITGDNALSGRVSRTLANGQTVQFAAAPQEQAAQVTIVQGTHVMSMPIKIGCDYYMD